MAQPKAFRPAFDELAVNGFIGDPNGQLAYAYIRVSDSDQAEDGRSGLPRQITHIHEVASKYAYKISWELVYADDYTGFEFEGRPALTKLRREYKSQHRQANVVVMEHLDRLSRNASWHQGFLIDEMVKHDIRPVFWKEFNSLLERTVLGAIAQDGMEQEKKRMMEGKLHKARSGRVTATTPAYGYKFVDSNGNDGANVKKDTHYAIYEDEASIVRIIFQRVLNGDTMRKIAYDLHASGIKPPKRSRYWAPSQVRLFIKNEVYKGDFYAHRWEEKPVEVPTKDGLGTQSIKRKVARPQDEWIHVPVPAIVSPQEWELANRVLEQNQKMARRNASEPYLLTGLIKCADCNYTYSGLTHRRNRGKLRNNPYRGYRCPNSGIRPKYESEKYNCKNGSISCQEIESAVWNVVCKTLLEPSILLDAFETSSAIERNKQIYEQIEYLERELVNRKDDDDKLLRAYLAGAFDEHELASRRKMLKSEIAKLITDLGYQRSLVLTPEQLEQHKEQILSLAERFQAENFNIDPPFEIKQRIIKLLVDRIVLNVREGWFRLEGAVGGTFPIVNIRAHVVISETPSSPALARQP
jgi:site-specific DNA recombinase